MTQELTAAEKAVFGADARKDDKGNIIEQGFGSVAKKSAKVLALEKPAEEKARAALTKMEERAALEKETREKDARDKEKGMLAKAADVFKDAVDF